MTAPAMNGTRTVKLLAILLGAIVLIVGSLSLSERLSSAGPYEELDDIRLYLPNADDEIEPGTKPVKPEFLAEPAYRYRDQSRSPSGYFEIPFEWHEGDPAPAVLLSFYRRLEGASLNGSPVAVADLTPESLLGGFVPAAIPLDPERLVDGENLLVLKDGGRSLKILGALKIVPVEDAYRAVFWGQFFEMHVVIAVTGIMIFVALFCLFMQWPREERFAVHMLVILLLVWSLRNLMAFGIADGLAQFPRLYSAYWIGFALSAAFSAYVVAWAGWARHHVLWPWALAIALMLASLIPMGQGTDATFDWLFPMENIFLPANSLFAIGVILWSEYRAGVSRPVQALLLIAALLAILIDALDERFYISIGFFDPQPFIYYATPRHGVLVALGVWSAMLFHQLRARRLSENLNAVLESKLQVRERELEKAYAERADLERRSAAVAERERIMMDVHDGLGARLLVLEQEASLDPPDLPLLREEIGGAIAEVRLIADQLASPDADFLLLWGALRHRLSARLDAAGIASEWTMDPALSNLVPGPQVAQHITRIVQEAVSNIIRHSGAQRAVFSAAPDPERPDLVHLWVEDDGAGTLEGEPTAGKGLGFMRRRAQLLGGTLNFMTGLAGARIALTFPIRPDPGPDNAAG